MTAKTVNGSIKASMGALDGDDLTYSAVNGSITLELPASLDADLDISTVNGRIDTDYPVTIQGTINRKRLRGTVGDGGRLLKASTVNGSVTLKRAARADHAFVQGVHRAGEREVLLRDAAGVVRAERERQLGVAHVHVGVVRLRLGHVGHLPQEVDPVGEGGKLVRARERVALARPGRQGAEGTLDFDVGEGTHAIR